MGLECRASSRIGCGVLVLSSCASSFRCAALPLIRQVKRRGNKKKTVLNAKTKSSPLHKHPLLPEVPKDLIERWQAKMLIPPGSYIWKGSAGSWSIHYPPYRRFSQSWSVSTPYEACLACLRHAWRLFLSDHSLGERDCPIQGLFSPLGQPGDGREDGKGGSSSSSSALSLVRA